MSNQSGAPYVTLTIQDTGAGIDPETLTHIFDPFFTTKSQGTGLGLSVAHGIIHEHGGLIDVKSDVGHGTSFTLQFPLLTEEKSPA
jgi:signal transduction histidine kinase